MNSLVNSVPAFTGCFTHQIKRFVSCGVFTPVSLASDEAITGDVLGELYINMFNKLSPFFAELQFQLIHVIETKLYDDTEYG